MVFPFKAKLIDFKKINGILLSHSFSKHSNTSTFESKRETIDDPSALWSLIMSFTQV